MAVESRNFSQQWPPTRIDSPLKIWNLKNTFMKPLSAANSSHRIICHESLAISCYQLHLSICHYESLAKDRRSALTDGGRVCIAVHAFCPRELGNHSHLLLDEHPVLLHNQRRRTNEKRREKERKLWARLSPQTLLLLLSLPPPPPLPHPPALLRCCCTTSLLFFKLTFTYILLNCSELQFEKPDGMDVERFNQSLSVPGSELSNKQHSFPFLFPSLYKYNINIHICLYAVPDSALLNRDFIPLGIFPHK